MASAQFAHLQGYSPSLTRDRPVNESAQDSPASPLTHCPHHQPEHDMSLSPQRQMASSDPAAMTIAARRMQRRWGKSGKQDGSSWPQGQEAWSRYVRVVRRDYMSARYDECLLRCEHVLRAVQEQSISSSRAHLVYLHFYAATCLELQCRGLHHASPTRLNLLTQAQAHYQSAFSAVSAEKEHMADAAAAPPPSLSSRSSSPCCSESPRASVLFSRGSVSTAMTSPVMSERSFKEPVGTDDAFGKVEGGDVVRTSWVDEEFGEEEEAAGREATVRERQEEEIDMETEETTEVLQDMEAEPINLDVEQSPLSHDVFALCRPDSPTLGLSDTESDSHIYRTPPLPIYPGDQSDTEVSSTPPEPSIQRNALHITIVDSETDPISSPAKVKHHAFPLDQSIHRYRRLLQSLQTQISTHLSLISAELVTSTSTTITASTAHAASPTHDAKSRVPLRLPDGDAQVRRLDLQARIARLKASGWKRRTFDAARYEKLREDAMADLLM